MRFQVGISPEKFQLLLNSSRAGQRIMVAGWPLFGNMLALSNLGMMLNIIISQGCDCSGIPVLYCEKCHICESCKSVEKKIRGSMGCMVSGGTSQTNMTDTVIGNCYLKSPRAYIILSTNCSMMRYHTLIGWRDQPSKLFLLKS